MDIKCAYTKMVPVKDIKLNPKNRNKHRKEQIDRLAELIDFYGVRHPLIISALDNTCAAGEGRFLAMKKLGAKEVPCDFQKFEDYDEQQAFGISDNAIGDWAELDFSGINEDIGELGPDFDVEMLGIENFELFPEDKDTSEKDDAVPEVKEDPKTKLGDLIILGNHRLLCGDSTVKENVDYLMDGQKADMVFTDPPYGVDYHGRHVGLYCNGDNKNMSRTRIKNDNSTEVYSSIFKFIDKFVLGPCYVFCGAGKERDVLNNMYDSKISVISTLIWRKDNGSTALNANYKPVYEMFYYFQIGKDRLWSGSHTERTVWDIDRNSKNEFHPTQKPIALIEKAIKNHTSKSVLDLFGGSGSTLIACEKTNRKCFMMELDPHYCDVIIKRYCDYTGCYDIMRNGEPER